MGFVNEKLSYDEGNELAKLFGVPRSNGDSRTIDHERGIWLQLLRTANEINGPYVRYGFCWGGEYISLWIDGGSSKQSAERRRLDEEALQQGFKKKNSDIYIRKIVASLEVMAQKEEMFADLKEAFRIKKFRDLDLDPETEVIMTLIDVAEGGN